MLPTQSSMEKARKLERGLAFNQQASCPPPTKAARSSILSRKTIAAWLCLLALMPATLAGLAVQLNLPWPEWGYSPILGQMTVATIVATLAAALFWPEGQKK